MPPVIARANLDLSAKRSPSKTTLTVSFTTHQSFGVARDKKHCEGRIGQKKLLESVFGHDFCFFLAPSIALFALLEVEPAPKL